MHAVFTLTLTGSNFDRSYRGYAFDWALHTFCNCILCSVAQTFVALWSCSHNHRDLQYQSGLMNHLHTHAIYLTDGAEKDEGHGLCRTWSTNTHGHYSCHQFLVAYAVKCYRKGKKSPGFSADTFLWTLMSLSRMVFGTVCTSDLQKYADTMDLL